MSSTSWTHIGSTDSQVPGTFSETQEGAKFETKLENREVIYDEEGTVFKEDLEITHQKRTAELRQHIERNLNEATNRLRKHALPVAESIDRDFAFKDAVKESSRVTRLLRAIDLRKPADDHKTQETRRIALGIAFTAYKKEYALHPSAAASAKIVDTVLAARDNDSAHETEAQGDSVSVDTWTASIIADHSLELMEENAASLHDWLVANFHDQDKGHVADYHDTIKLYTIVETATNTMTSGPKLRERLMRKRVEDNQRSNESDDGPLSPKQLERMRTMQATSSSDFDTRNARRMLLSVIYDMAREDAETYLLRHEQPCTSSWTIHHSTQPGEETRITTPIPPYVGTRQLLARITGLGQIARGAEPRETALESDAAKIRQLYDSAFGTQEKMLQRCTTARDNEILSLPFKSAHVAQRKPPSLRVAVDLGHSISGYVSGFRLAADRVGAYQAIERQEKEEGGGK
jgi:hypothetical protein